MLGLEDKYVALAFILCLLSTLLCVVYGALNWNKGKADISEEDKHWAEEEKKVEEEI